jgi:hypothetical protein
MCSKFLLTICSMIISSGLFACSCTPGESIVDAFKSADLIFEGKVVKTDTVFVSDTVKIISSKNSKRGFEIVVRKYLSVQFSITRLLKGATNKMAVTIMTEAAGSRCGFQFLVNINYLVYGYTGNFSLIDSKDIVTAQNTNKKIKTLNIAGYSTNSCARTTTTIEREFSELKSNKLIK